MPSALADYVVTRRDAPVKFNPVANDDGIVSVSAMATPAHGTIAPAGGNWFIYTPDPGFVGQEQFSYTGRDAANVAYNATIIIRVRRPNVDTRIAPLTLDVEASGARIQLLEQITNPDGDTLQVTVIEAPQYGTISLTNDFEITYTPEAGYTGPDQFGYVVSDGDSNIRGEVKLNVSAYTNTAPVASNFSQSVAFNTPIDIDVPAHQTDADGDPIQTQITAAPAHGTATVLTNQKVHYTPTTGYSGADQIKWKPFDGQDLGNEGIISITVAASVLPTYANGYLARRRIVIPPRTTNASAPAETDYVVLIRETLAAFKHLPYGGKIQHPSGWDFRVETEAGVQLDHKLESYDPATGAIVLWFRIPSWAVHQQARFLLYYGNPTISAHEQDVAGTYSGYLAVINARTGVDETGNSRTFTPSDTIASGIAIGDAASFAGDKVATAADPTWLNGHAGITVQTVINPATGAVGSNKGWFTQGPTDGNDASASFILQYLASSGASTNLVHFKIKASDGTSYVLSAANRHATGLQVVHGSWTQGEAPKIYLGGVSETPAAVGAARAGTTSAIASQAAYIGRGQRDAASGGWLGLVDELRIRAGGITALRAAAEAANILSPATFYAIGAEDLPADTTATESPVALPVSDTVQSALEKDFDVAAAAYIPGGSAPTLSAVGTVAHGDRSIVANKVHYQPVSQYVGADGCTFTLTRAGKSVSNWLGIEVLGPAQNRPGTEPPTDFPKDPPVQTNPAKIRTVGYTGPGGAALQYATIAAAIAAAVAGDEIRVNDGIWREAIDTAKSGSAAGGHIVIRPRNHLGATLAGAASPSTDKWGSGNCRSWKFTGSYIWVTGFISANPAQHTPDSTPDKLDKNYYFNSDRPETAFRLHGHHMLVTNCLIKSPQGIGIPDDAHHIDVCYNTFADQIAPVWNQNNTIFMGHITELSNGPDYVTIARNRWMNDAALTNYANDDQETRFCIYVGNSHLTSSTANCGVNRTVRIWENHVNVDKIGRGFYIKRTFDVRRNYIAVSINSGNQQGFQLRHGGYSKPNGEVFTDPPLSNDTRGWIEGNNFAAGKVYINDTDHLWLGNRFAKDVELRYGGRRWKKNATSTAWIPSSAEGWIQAASRNWFIGCQFNGSLVLGTGEDSNNGPYRLETDQGGVITGVRVYRGIQAAPTVVRKKDWDDNKNTTPPKPSGAGVDAVAAGDAGCQILTGTNGYTVPTWVTGPDLIASGVGCDPAP